jgi:Uncharacterized protein conserved in bacteria (DUF2252)
MMNILKSTEGYEQWLGQRLTLVEADLYLKHGYMAEDFFDFMRATFYRWVQLWVKHGDDLADAPVVLSVGDLHTDNFGSWRDIESRLVWGINDFDEAYPLPYTFDLVRLAASAYLALSEDYGTADLETISRSILSGYQSGLTAGGKPFVLAEENGWLRDLMIEHLKEPERFWEKLEALPHLPDILPEDAKQAIEAALPQPGLRYYVSHRTAGLGSLGRQRFLAMMKLSRAQAAREAKELTASACLWALKDKGSSEIFYSKILEKAVRSFDPFLQIHDRWVVRRLSPDYNRIELTDLENDTVHSLLKAMGWETANIHLGSGEVIKDVRKDLKDKKDKETWLADAADRMIEALSADFEEWQAYWEETERIRA